MVEYGGGINNGPAGQVGGGPQVGTDADFFGNVGNAVGDVWNTVASMPTEMLVAAVVIVFLGLMIFKRAF
jgi:hypothetical protein